jgi:hypothetical protein
MVPQTETRQATQTVCRMIAATENRTICEASGHWETRPIQTTCCSSGCGSACGGCAPAVTQCACQVWIPETIQKQIQVTVMKPTYEQVPYQYQVTVCHPETRTSSYQVCEYQPEQKTRQISCTVCVPKTRTVAEQVTTYRCVAEQKTRPYTVMVSYQEQQQIQVPVCKMVSQTIKVPVCRTCCMPCQ